MTIRARMRDLRDAVVFHTQSPDWETVVSEDLPFGLEANELFLSKLASAEQYLEYGAGSSTLAAVRTGCSTVTVESDPAFLRAIERRCGALVASESSDSVRFLRGDIGPTGPWGKPIFPSITRAKRWRNYALAPWSELGSDFRADVVLVDGRFRVASALAVVRNQPDVDWTILVDDFVGRAEYAPITDFARFVGTSGRMAEFRPMAGVRTDEVDSVLRHFSADWR